MQRFSGSSKICIIFNILWINSDTHSLHNCPGKIFKEYFYSSLVARICELSELHFKFT